MGRIALLIGVLTLLAGCGGTTTSTQRPGNAATTVRVAMGYVQNVQFAPFYVAQARGYYRKAGLNVHFQYGIEPDLLRLASNGNVDLVDSGGDEVLVAGAQGLHVRYVMTQFTRFPSAVLSLTSAHIARPTDLRGHTIGVPGKYGATYVGLLALLQRAHVPSAAVKIETIGFTQAASVAQKKVDAAVGYANNDAVQLRLQGKPINEIDVYRYANLAGAGIAAGGPFLTHHPAAVHAFVKATLHGMRDTLNNPSRAFAISAKAAGVLPSDMRTQRAVFYRSLFFWKAEAGHPLGWVDPAIWKLTARDLLRFAQLPHAVNPTAYYTNRFITG